MKTKMNLNGTTRKTLVAAISEITGEKAIYRNMPTSNYDIGGITVTKDGCIICPDESTILTALAAAGFFPEEAEPVAEEPTGLTVSLPENGFTEAVLDNLRKLVDAKASLITKAMGTDRLDITVADGKVSFPWWDRMLEPEDTQAYMSFLAALCAIRDGRRRWTPMGEMPILSGMLFCADCGSKLYQVRHRGWTHEQEIFVCAKYRKHKGCTPHQIHNVQVEEILLRELKRITAYAREHEDDFIRLVTKQSETELNRQLRSSNRELAQAEERIGKLDSLIQRLYEDNVEGKISDERFAKLSASYEAEQNALESRVKELRQFINAAKEDQLNVDSFIGMVRKYTDITELTAEIIRSFVERIEVLKPEKIPGTRTKKQTIVIYWNFIGAVEIPDGQEKTA